MGQEVKMDEYEGGVRPPLLYRLAKPLCGAWPWQGWCLPVHCVKEGVKNCPRNGLKWHLLDLSGCPAIRCNLVKVAFFFFKPTCCLLFLSLTIERDALVTGQQALVEGAAPSLNSDSFLPRLTISMTTDRMFSSGCWQLLSSWNCPMNLVPPFFLLNYWLQKDNSLDSASVNQHLVLLKTFLHFCLNAPVRES